MTTSPSVASLIFPKSNRYALMIGKVLTNRDGLAIWRWRYCERPIIFSQLLSDYTVSNNSEDKIVYNPLGSVNILIRMSSVLNSLPFGFDLKALCHPVINLIDSRLCPPLPVDRTWTSLVMTLDCIQLMAGATVTTAATKTLAPGRNQFRTCAKYRSEESSDCSYFL